MTNTPLRVALALACVTSLAACDRAKSGAETAVRASLKDPDSAKFGDFYYNEKTKKGCLAVNARNSMGGYTGFEQAAVERTDKGWEVIGIDDSSLELCRQAFADPTQKDYDAVFGNGN